MGKSKRHTRLDISSKLPTISATDRRDQKFVRKLADVLPQMIEDVIQVVQCLGQRFLWIDAYCINQNDPAEVQETVTRMDDIYENALLTICIFWKTPTRDFQ